MNVTQLTLEPTEPPDKFSNWKDRYGEKHRWRRYSTFLPGITPPVKVRLYERAGHFLLNWWDPTAKKNLSERISGDLITALTRARQINDRIVHFRTAGNDALFVAEPILSRASQLAAGRGPDTPVTGGSEALSLPTVVPSAS